LRDKLLHTNEEKLEYIIKLLKLKHGDISQKLGISSSMLSQIQNPFSSKLKPYHLFAMAQAYSLPMEIFENVNINASSQIKQMLLTKETNHFYKNRELLNKLVGVWYLYSYPSNPNYTEVHITKHTIYDNGKVVDEHNNRGKVYFGKNQSLIVKESNNSKNLTTITFDNNRVTYENFIFSRVSKSINLNKELFNFGFFSRDKLEVNEVKRILGNKEKSQVQIDYGMLERLNQIIKIKES